MVFGILNSIIRISRPCKGLGQVLGAFSGSEIGNRGTRSRGYSWSRARATVQFLSGQEIGGLKGLRGRETGQSERNSRILAKKKRGEPKLPSHRSDRGDINR